MKYYRVLKTIIAAIVVLYLFVGNFSWSRYGKEIFPIYSWDLFSYVPNLSSEYALKIKSIDQVPLESPDYFQQLPSQFSQADSIIAFNVIQKFGSAIELNDLEGASELKNQIDREYLFEYAQVEYDVYKITYYAAKRWRTGTFETETIIASYDTANP